VAQFSQPQMTPPILLAVPNVSEGRDQRAIDAVRDALSGAGGSTREIPPEGEPAQQGGGASPTPAQDVRLLDTHSDPDHHRTVFTLCGHQGELATALVKGAAAAIARIDVMGGRSAGEGNAQHPHVGALDVAPLVYLDPAARGAACAEALVVADRIGGELGVPVFLYGELTAGDGGSVRTRAELRRGGAAGLAERMATAERAQGGQRPDFGPPRMHPTAGATLVAAREPLVAFNLQLAPPATIADARAIAAMIREGGEEGLPGLRAIGVQLSGNVAQVSMNIERPLELSLADVVAALRRHAQLQGAELVGLAPRAALVGFPDDIALPGFDPARHLIENALGL
jgi:glutamate formiminotransferase / 5-formyltetrahydrofolate cyclo-ligase